MPPPHRKLVCGSECGGAACASCATNTRACSNFTCASLGRKSNAAAEIARKAKSGRQPAETVTRAHKSAEVVVVIVVLVVLVVVLESATLQPQDNQAARKMSYDPKVFELGWDFILSGE